MQGPNSFDRELLGNTSAGSVVPASVWGTGKKAVGSSLGVQAQWLAAVWVCQLICFIFVVLTVVLEMVSMSAVN